MSLTDSEREELNHLVHAARRQASAAGPLHGLWDVIADGEALLHERPALLPAHQVLATLRSGAGLG